MFGLGLGLRDENGTDGGERVQLKHQSSKQKPESARETMRGVKRKKPRVH